MASSSASRWSALAVAIGVLPNGQCIHPAGIGNIDLDE
jgi:hypothetical protein